MNPEQWLSLKWNGGSTMSDRWLNQSKIIQVKKSLRSASGVIAAINDMRNRHSLSHPNDDLLKKREAEFAIKLIKDMSDYINDII